MVSSKMIAKALSEGQLTSPAYVFDYEELQKHMKKMIELAAGKVSFCYAMKANPFLITFLSEWVDKIEVCSPGELEICRYAQIAGEHILFSGVNKTEEDIATAMEYPAGIITIESRKHWELVCEYCRKHEKTAKVLLRLTNGSQFGMNEEVFEEIIENRAETAFIQIEGIHFFTGTQKRKYSKIEEEWQFVQEYMEHLKQAYNYTPKLVEYGAGLAVPYFEEEDFAKRYEDLEKLLQLIGESKNDYAVTLELGRFIAASCGTYITTVDDIKTNKDNHYAIVDGGIHQLNYYGQNMAMRVPVIEQITEDYQTVEEACDDEVSSYTICGSLCTFADVLVRKKKMKQLSEGDFLLFRNAGAYSVTESPALFLSRKLPDVYSFADKKGFVLVRRGKQAYEINLGI